MMDILLPFKRLGMTIECVCCRHQRDCNETLHYDYGYVDGCGDEDIICPPEEEKKFDDFRVRTADAYCRSHGSIMWNEDHTGRI